MSCLHSLSRDFSRALTWSIGRFQEEFGDEFEGDGARPAELEARLEFVLEHKLGAGGFSPRGTVEIVVGAASPKPKVSFSAVPTLSSDEIEQFKVRDLSG